VAIEFAIMKDGRLAEMNLLSSSGDAALDRAAWGGITKSDPFPKLPVHFTGPYLILRTHLYYNLNKSDFPDTASTAPVSPIIHAVLMAGTAESNHPKYPTNARKAKLDGIVRLEATIGTDGAIKDLEVTEGNPALAAVAVHAIQKWRFSPAQKDGKPVEDLVRIQAEFRLDGGRVSIWPEPAPPAQPVQ